MTFKPPVIKSFAGGAFKRPQVKSFKKNEADLEAEVNGAVVELEKQVKSAEKQALDAAVEKTRKQFWDEYDSEFWFCLVFQTRDQKDAFLKSCIERGLLPPKSGDKYLSGTALAKAMGVPLPPGPKWREPAKPKARWAAMAREDKEKPPGE